ILSNLWTLTRSLIRYPRWYAGTRKRMPSGSLIGLMQIAEWLTEFLANEVLLLKDKPFSISRWGGDLAACVRGMEFLKELVAQIINQFSDLLLVPLVFTLIVINGVLYSLEQLSDCFGFTEDFS